MKYDEGVIKFSARHATRDLAARQYGDLACKLSAWREVLALTGLVGQERHRYGGAGFGNISARVGAPSAGRGSRSFLITGTQTGGLECIGLEHYCVVQRYDLARNTVESEGAINPSSESMTHGSIYDLTPEIRFVFHGHSPAIWRRAREMKLPLTAEDVPYGTPAMAYEVQKLWRDTRLAEMRILAMGGHEDGVVVFGRNAEEAGQTLMTRLAAAYEYQCRAGGTLCRGR